VVRRLLQQAGGGRDVTHRHLLRALAFLRSARPATRLELPGGLVLSCERAGFRLGPLP
jgi:hypothetical protein